MKRLIPSIPRVATVVMLTLGLSVATALPSLAADDPETPADPEYIPVLIQFDDEAVLDELQADGADVWRRRGDMALVLLPNQGETDGSARRIAGRRGIVRVERPRRSHPVMDAARTHFGASDVTDGLVDGTPYTGKGVVVGFCDTGFDPTHVNFLDSEGKTRVAQFVIYDEYSGKREVLTTHEEMAVRGTDFDGHFHATHVAGIMAGGGGRSPYKGIATDAEIVATTSSLTDVGILCGLEDIIDYAREQDKPAVVNMSLANHLGPHDGTSLFCRWVDLASEEATIVISSGNSGAITSSFVHTFDEKAEPVRIRVHTGDWIQFHVEGGAAVWGDDDSPVRARLIIYDDSYRREVHAFEWVSSEEGYWAVDSESDELFGKYFTGNVELIGEVDPASGRSSVTAWFLTDTEESQEGHNWARYTFALEIEGEAGHTVYAYSDGAGTRLTTYPGYPNCSPAMSINDLATAKTAVSVGMYVNKKSVPLLGGGESVSPDATLSVNPRSSYGVLADGRVLPLTVAPGSNVVSSMSRHYLRRYPEMVGQCSYQEYASGGTAKIVGEDPHRWIPYHGTSMSAPYVSGFIATWLQADPTLTSAEIRDLIATTNHHSYPNPHDPRHGQGWFDPRAGLEKILAQISVGSVAETPDQGPQVSFNGGAIVVCQPAGTESLLEIYDSSGRLVSRQVIDGIISEVAQPEGSGLYLVRLADLSGRYVPRTLKIQKISEK